MLFHNVLNLIATLWKSVNVNKSVTTALFSGNRQNSFPILVELALVAAPASWGYVERAFSVCSDRIYVQQA